MKHRIHSTSSTSLSNRIFPKWAIWTLILILLIMLSMSCNLPMLRQANSVANTTGNPAVNAMSLAKALATTPRDDRPGILKQMGPPDAFRITFEELNDQTVRREEWSYFDFQTRFDYVDGTLVATTRIEAVPDGTIFASTYDPLSFAAGMSLANLSALLADQKLLFVDATDSGLPGGVVAAGSQILLGFDHDQLVYVETIVLTPEVLQ
jgi:hypothetical protein